MDDPYPISIAWSIVLQFILIALNAVFACAEIAVVSMNDNKLAKLAAGGNKQAVRLARLTSKPAKFLATIQVAITLSGFLGSAFAANNFAGLLAELLYKENGPISKATLSNLCVILITIVLSYFTLVFGELVPKRVAMKKAEKLALGMSGLISFFAGVFAPIVWLLTSSTNVILRLFGIDPHANEENVTEEEIRMMIDVGSEKGAIDAQEKEMIQNVFEFDEITADEIATHRTEITLLWLEESPEEWEETINNSHYSMYPVCDESVDNVIGVLNAKMYFRLKDKSRENVMKNVVKPAYFVPENVKADVLLQNMKKTRNKFAIVLDEYGGMSGIVTMFDLIEQLLGDLEEEDDTDPEYVPDIEKIDSSTWKISGNTPIEDVEEELKIEIDTDEYDTFGGLVFGAYGSIPEDGSTFEIEIDKLIVKVLEVKEHRVEKTIVCLKQPELVGQQEEN